MSYQSIDAYPRSDIQAITFKNNSFIAVAKYFSSLA